MIVYYEILFFLNCFIHYVISKITARFFRIKLDYRRMLVSYILICINLYLFINYDVMKYFKYAIGYILSFVTFNRKSIIVFITYFSANIMLAGTTMIYKLYNHKTIIIYCIPVIIVYEILGYIKEEKTRNKYYYSIMFKLDRIYKMNAYLDTGNNLVEPKTNIPVILINEEINNNRKVKIPYQTIGNTDYLEGVYCKNFYIKINQKYIRKEVFIASKKTKYEGLLNVLLF